VVLLCVCMGVFCYLAAGRFETFLADNYGRVAFAGGR
jgi:hypothetical protein